MKKYKTGMYGGKFLPMHLGHYHCLKTASDECETVYLILFYGGNQEYESRKENPNMSCLSIDFRVKQIFRAAKQFDNVIPIILDISECKTPEGEEDWDAETPMVLKACGASIDAVYGSEPSYAEYFNRAYPFAEYRMLDPDRKYIHISGTEIRKMGKKERAEWMV